MTSFQYQIIADCIGMLTEKPDTDLSALATRVGYTATHLQKMFKKWAGVSPKQFAESLRKEQALRLLDEGASTEEASLELGYSDTSTLHRQLIKLEAMTPAEIRKKGEGMTFRIARLPSVYGPFFVAGTLHGVNSLEFETDNLDYLEWQTQLAKVYPLATFVEDADQFAHLPPLIGGTLNDRAEPVRLKVAGTAFQVKVWQALINIQAGQLKTYGQIAREIQQPRASRAVGTAIGQNPVAWLIPCHRVINSTGIIGNYRWESLRKQAMIGREVASKISVF